MGLLDSLKGMLGGKKGASTEIPGLPKDMNTVDEIKDKVEGVVSEDIVNKVTDAIPGQMDDKIADKIMGDDDSTKQ